MEYKPPLNLTAEDLEELINVPIIWCIGKPNKEGEEIEGKLTNFSRAANPTHLPVDFMITKINGEEVTTTAFDIKWYRKI